MTFHRLMTHWFTDGEISFSGIERLAIKNPTREDIEELFSDESTCWYWDEAIGHPFCEFSCTLTSSERDQYDHAFRRTIDYLVVGRYLNSGFYLSFRRDGTKYHAINELHSGDGSVRVKWMDHDLDFPEHAFHPKSVALETALHYCVLKNRIAGIFPGSRNWLDDSPLDLKWREL